MTSLIFFDKIENRIVTILFSGGTLKLDGRIVTFS